MLRVINLGMQLHHIGRRCSHLYPMIVRIVVRTDDDRHAQVRIVGGVGVDVHLVMSGFLTFLQGLFLVQLGHDTVKRGGRNLRVGEH